MSDQPTGNPDGVTAEELTEQGARLRRALIARRGFPPDPFQDEAFAHLDRGDSVLVAAPTSAGKTLVAEYAISRARATGGTVAYTTPIKALSNQKLSDLTQWLGTDETGLLTGDNVIRGDAPVVVMTTEVLRNMIYAESPRLDDLAVVILDEVHYLQDPYRGPVWEEVIIQLPPHVQLVCLSATVSNARELASWIAEVRGSCACVIERERPVALHDHFLLAERGSRRMREFRTVRDGRPNEEVARFLARAGVSGGGGRHDHRRKGLRPARPRRTEIVHYLDERARLPAIYFIFSRAGCDDAVRQCIEAGIGFLDGRERQRVEMIAEQHVRDLSDHDLALLGYRDWLRSLQSGVAAHHAGMVTPFKETVEDCFEAGLIHVVFATETLALGVNLPAKSVVIESLSRFRGEGHVMLTPGEYTQLTGRAGRRGIDSVGHAYTLWNPYNDFHETASLVASNQFELSSAFRPTYNMAANLIATRTHEDAIGLLHRSFAQFRSDRRIVGWSEQLRQAKADLSEATNEYRSRFDEAPAASLSTSNGDDPKTIGRALRRLSPGDVIAQPRQHGVTHLLVIGTSSRKGGEHRVRVVGLRGKTLMLGPGDFDRAPSAIGDVALPKPFAPNRREFQRAAARALRAHVQENGLDVPTPRQRGGNGTDRERQRLAQRIERLRGTVASLGQRVTTAKRDLGSTLDGIVQLLNEVGCADGWSLTASGDTLSAIFHERDLVLALALHRGLLDGLTAPEIALVASTISYEHRGRHAPPTPWFPTPELRDRARSVERLIGDIRHRERRLGLPETIESSNGFAAIAHGWAAGIELADLLQGEELGAGDFVRNIRQLVDLLRQIADVAPNGDTIVAARQAIKAIDRGVVAAATRLNEAAVDTLEELAAPDPEPR